MNDIWGGDDLIEWGKKLWETKLEDGLILIDRAIKTHIITSYHGLPRLRAGGLVVEITDGDAYYYRGPFLYDIVSRACTCVSACKLNPSSTASRRAGRLRAS